MQLSTAPGEQGHFQGWAALPHKLTPQGPGGTVTEGAAIACPAPEAAAAESSD